MAMPTNDACLGLAFSRLLTTIMLSDLLRDSFDEEELLFLN